MSSELINALESRVSIAVDTIEDLRSEIKVLKEERQLLENKLRELLNKIERSDGGESAKMESQPPMAPSPEPVSEPSSMNSPFSSGGMPASIEQAPVGGMESVGGFGSSTGEEAPGTEIESNQQDSSFGRSKMGYGPFDSDY